MPLAEIARNVTRFPAHDEPRGFGHDDFVTPERRSTDLIKSRLTLRDVVLLVVGAAGMWGTQVATQWKTQSSIERLDTKFDGYVQKQTDANNEFQRQIDEVRKTANMGVAVGNDAAKEAARLEGILLGAGIKGVQK